MKRKIMCLTALLLIPGLANAASEDDPILTKVLIDQLEIRATDGPNPWVLDAQAWIGGDLNKLWFKTEVEVVDGDTEEAEIQALYSRAIAPYWDLQAGWRRDIRPSPSHDWFAIGVEGLAPYWFEVEATAFAGEGGQLSGRFKAEYEWMFTQKWILSPEIEMNFYSRNDEAVGIGSGLSDMEVGLRLRYEVRREFAPYIGVNWTGTFGNTADYARDEGEDTNDFQFVAGIRAWF